MSTDTLTDNELIAEFMGLKKVTVGYFGVNPGDEHLEPETAWQLLNSDWMDKVGLEDVGDYAVNVNDDYWIYWSQVKYDTSWDWLMPVVEKIESLGYYTNIFRDEDGQQTAILHPVPSYNRDESSMIVPNDPMRGNKSKIDTTYNAVVEFIKWYNQQPK